MKFIGMGMATIGIWLGAGLICFRPESDTATVAGLATMATGAIWYFGMGSEL